MHSEQFKLLITFKCLYEERSVVKAAERINTGQSAVSKQLGKLRHWFDDELFVRTAHGMEPTEKASLLIHKVEALIEQFDALDNVSSFDSHSLTGHVVIETTDEVSRRISPALLNVFDDKSPQLSLHIRRLAQQYDIRDLETGKVDIAISVNWHAPEQLVQKRLCSDTFVVLTHMDNPLLEQPLTLECYANAKHMLVAPLSSPRGYIDDVLAEQGWQRRVHLTVPTFGEVSPALLQQNFIVTLPKRVAEEMAKEMPVCIKPLPFEVPNFHYYMFWHRRFTNNQRHQWVREQVLSTFAS